MSRGSTFNSKYWSSMQCICVKESYHSIQRSQKSERLFKADRTSSGFMRVSILTSSKRSLLHCFIEAYKTSYAHFILLGSRVVPSFNAAMSSLLVKNLTHGKLWFTEDMFLSSGVLRQYGVKRGWQHHNLSEVCTANPPCGDKRSGCNIQ